MTARTSMLVVPLPLLFLLLPPAARCTLHTCVSYSYSHQPCTWSTGKHQDMAGLAPGQCWHGSTSAAAVSADLTGLLLPASDLACVLAAARLPALA